MFRAVAGREVHARFDHRTLTSDGGVVLLREEKRRTGILRHFAGCFTDYRDPAREKWLRFSVQRNVVGYPRA